MIRNALVFSLCMLFIISAVAFAQTLDGSRYDPAKDANIDLYLNSYENSEPRIIHGALEERDILFRGDHLKPPAKGAVLEYANRLSHGTLAPGTSTTSTSLKGEQYVIYILSGRGRIKAGWWKKADLYSGIGVFMPANRSFTMTNTGDEPLTMFIISEPVPEGFKPVKNMVVKDENTTPISSTSGHWCHIVRGLFGSGDGLATIGVITVAVDPMTFPHPHSHSGNFEEVWAAIKGTSLAFLGKQIRKQPPGTAYMIPPDGNTPHSNINTSDRQIKFLYFSARK